MQILIGKQIQGRGVEQSKFSIFADDNLGPRAVNVAGKLVTPWFGESEDLSQRKLRKRKILKENQINKHGMLKFCLLASLVDL